MAPRAAEAPRGSERGILRDGGQRLQPRRVAGLDLSEVWFPWKPHEACVTLDVRAKRLGTWADGFRWPAPHSPVFERQL